MAAYESGKGKKDITILNYFRGDYIGFQVLKAVIAATISFFLMFAVYIFYNFETFMQDIYKMDLLSFGKSVSSSFSIRFCIRRRNSDLRSSILSLSTQVIWATPKS